MNKTQQQFLRQMLARIGASKAGLSARLGCDETALDAMLLPAMSDGFVEMPFIYWVKADTSQQEFLRKAMRQMNMTRAQFSKRISTPIKTLNKWMLPAGGGTVMPDNVWRFVYEITKDEGVSDE